MLYSCHGNTIYTFLQLQIPALPAQLPDPSPATALSRCPALAEAEGLHHTLSLLTLQLPGARAPPQLPARSPQPRGAEPGAAPQSSSPATSQSISRDFKGKRCLEPALSHALATAQDHPPLPIPSNRPSDCPMPSRPAARTALRAWHLQSCSRRARQAHSRGDHCFPAHASASVTPKSQLR